MDRQIAAFDVVSTRTEFEPNQGYVAKLLMTMDKYWLGDLDPALTILNPADSVALSASAGAMWEPCGSV